MDRLTVIVVSHDQKWLRRIHAIDKSQRIFKIVSLQHLPLGSLQSNLLGESRALLFDHQIDSEYVGIINGRWNEKYHYLETKIEQLPSYIIRRLKENVVFAPWPTISTHSGNQEDWYQNTLNVHPEMKKILLELAEFSKLSLSPGPSLWANDFICHKSHWDEWLVFWRKCFHYFHSRYGFLLPYGSTNLDVARQPAYFYERVTTLYFANQHHLSIEGIK